MPLDEQATEPRRKRAKIVSACGECRRKKTKCNGETPCRNCEKSGVPCIYPSTSVNDDKRNAPSKAALEAIEERLKTIEDMLRTIIRSQNLLIVDDSAANFPHRDSKSSASSASSPPLMPQTMHTPPPPPSPSPSNRLPSIHSLSSSYPAEPKLEHRDLPPLGFQNYNYPNNCKYQPENENYMKKRKL
ncbi:hypothetical protein G6F70_006313 [Rhizopus microsporus]|uniref:Zn(2)-C6 fungal-type domain-containing protein n=1 Tax=Rhizopus microsporus TaxID=58291 RepID=A0A0A1NZZ3_RHIZD|nr:hypothetical protein G6F71_006211 [Rhizopus microsporus]KAG1197845.1 hypothetical protein G6F70_006313 [Rhizopus microsporus]KAG1206743.1 hypothetical protein G6F69_008604 [Rhizopus microsporus]KAG1227800.1 hypothetical protein G6F67_008223 [Rhizopus microsporus]KAG1263435.1 hypothetical protein G6F68_005149 [Rhizopus microsporus]